MMFQGKFSSQNVRRTKPFFVDSRKGFKFIHPCVAKFRMNLAELVRDIERKKTGERVKREIGNNGYRGILR
jgi:hypothetical protein